MYQIMKQTFSHEKNVIVKPTLVREPDKFQRFFLRHSDKITSLLSKIFIYLKEFKDNTYESWQELVFILSVIIAGLGVVI